MAAAAPPICWLADITLLDLSAPGPVPLNDAFHHLAYRQHVLRMTTLEQD